MSNESVAQPIFILGSTRSGTSLLARLLQQLGIAGDAEGHVWTLYGEMYRALEQHQNFMKKAFQGDPPPVTFAHLDHEQLLDGVRQSFLDAMEMRYPDPVWFDKTPNVDMLRISPQLQSLFPRARFIYIQRNGVENLSSARKKFTGKAFAELCSKWASCIEAWVDVRDQLANTLELEHRDLVERPDLVARQLVNFLGLAPGNDERIVEFITGTHPQRTSSHYRPVSLASSGWSDRDRGIFIQMCGPMMSVAGYGRFLDWERPAGASTLEVENGNQWVSTELFDQTGAIVMHANAPGQSHLLCRLIKPRALYPTKLRLQSAPTRNGASSMTLLIRLIAPGQPVAAREVPLQPGDRVDELLDLDEACTEILELELRLAPEASSNDFCGFRLSFEAGELG